MRKRVLVIATMSVIAVLVAGGLFASNMGFKLTYSLLPASDPNSADGKNTLSLPYIPMTGISDAFQLCNDINSIVPSSVSSIVRIDTTASGSLQFVPYNCVTGTAFTLVPQESYEVNVVNQVDYPIVGSHDPTQAVQLTKQGDALPTVLHGGGTSDSGRNRWAYPYHSTATDAKALCDEINAITPATVSSIVKIDTSLTGAAQFVPYNCVTGSAFALVPGEGYDINVVNTITGWIPDHF